MYHRNSIVFTTTTATASAATATDTNTKVFYTLHLPLLRLVGELFKDTQTMLDQTI